MNYDGLMYIFTLQEKTYIVLKLLSDPFVDCIIYAVSIKYFEFKKKIELKIFTFCVSLAF